MLANKKSIKKEVKNVENLIGLWNIKVITLYELDHDINYVIYKYLLSDSYIPLMWSSSHRVIAKRNGGQRR